MTTAVADPPPPKHVEPVNRPRLAKLLRVLAIPIIIFWVLAAVVTNVFVPNLDDVTADNAGPLVARDAPSAQAAIHQGNDFHESNYTSVAVLILQTKSRKLGAQDHQYYNEVVRRYWMTPSTWRRFRICGASRSRCRGHKVLTPRPLR